MSVKRSGAMCPVWANDAAHGRWYQTESNVRMPTSYACRVGPVHSAATAAVTATAIPAAANPAARRGGRLARRASDVSSTLAAPATAHAATIGASSNQPTVPSSSRIAISVASAITISDRRAGAPPQSSSQRRRTLTAASASDASTTTRQAAPSA